MSREQMVSNMKFILSGEDLERVTVRETENGLAYIDVDLHGLTRKQAERLVKNIINVNRGEFVLNVIHGFNHGTVLKEMIMETRWSSRVVDRSCPAWNPGQTFLTVAA